MKLLILIIILFTTLKAQADTVSLEWERISDATSYEISLRGEKVEIINIKQASWRGELPPGKYYFKIRSLDQRGVAGEWSEESSFLVRPLEVKSVKVKKSEQDKKLFFSWSYNHPYDFFRVIVKKNGKEIYNKKTENLFQELLVDTGEYEVGVKAISRGVLGKINYKKLTLKEKKRKLASQKINKDKPKNNKVKVSVSNISKSYSGLYQDSFGFPFGVELNYDSLVFNLDYTRKLKYFNVIGKIELEKTKISSEDLNFLNYGLGLSKGFSFNNFLMETEIGLMSQTIPEIQPSFSGETTVDQVENLAGYGSVSLGYKVQNWMPGVKYKYQSVVGGEASGSSSDIFLFLEYQRNTLNFSLWLQLHELDRTLDTGNTQTITGEGLGIGIKYDF